MIIRYRVEVDMWGRRVGIPDEGGDYVIFVPDGVACDVVRPGIEGVAVCTDRSEVRKYTVNRFRVYVYTGEEWVKIGTVNKWLTSVEEIYTWRPSIWVMAGVRPHEVSDRSREFLLEVAKRENCRKYGCITDFYGVWRPKEGHSLLHLIDLAITKKGWKKFGVA